MRAATCGMDAPDTYVRSGLKPGIITMLCAICSVRGYTTL